MVVNLSTSTIILLRTRVRVLKKYSYTSTITPSLTHTLTHTHTHTHTHTPVKQLSHGQVLSFKWTLKASPCCQLFNCSSNSNACVFTMAGHKEIPFAIQSEVIAVVTNIFKILEIFVLGSEPDQRSVYNVNDRTAGKASRRPYRYRGTNHQRKSGSFSHT